MPRKRYAVEITIPRQRLITALCAGLLLSASPFSLSPLSFSALSVLEHPTWIAVAHAQQLDRATQVLFLAVEKNDLPGVQAAVNGGADITARQINGMQAVDLAIERGYFDIAHYLISVRNQIDAQGKPAKPAPSLQQLAQDQRAKQEISPAPQPSATAVPPAPEVPAGTPNPFEAPRASDGLPVIGEVREPTAPEKTATEVAKLEKPQAADAPARTDTPASTPAGSLADTPTKPSATKSFFSTFTDFFKPPNTTGIVRRDTSPTTKEQGALTDEELNKQLKEIEAEMGNALIKGPAVPISPDELARELPPAPDIPADAAVPGNAPFDTPALPPYRVTSQGAPTPQPPEISSKDAFGGLEVADVTAEDNRPATSSPPGKSGAGKTTVANVLDTDLPFNGGVDPDILALLGMKSPDKPASEPATTGDQVAEADPFASPSAPSDPFATPPSGGKPDSVASVLEGIGEPKDVPILKTNKPSLPGDKPTDSVIDPFATPAEGAGDPFAAPAPDTSGPIAPADPFATPAPPKDAPKEGEVDELAGLLEGVGEKVASKQDGWDVKEVENAPQPDQVPALSEIKPTGKPLDGVVLTLGAEAIIGQEVGEERLKLMDQETIHKPCLKKGGPETVFCVDKVSWPFELEEDFLVDTIMYQGTRSIARYDAGRASNFHALFNTGSFTKVVNYYISRFGQPTEKVERAIAPLAQPRRDNPTYMWHSREAGTDSIVTLEIRQFDDARSGFPDTRRGAVLLYREHAGEIFPLLSQLELMVLKDDGEQNLAPKTPESVW